ncbi:MAG: hypothetical protein HN580_04700 [Deltaproteobacteria bacterium]|nr:hypothetical protein [Deltaproteobacteria bacterium]MBT4264226.1 hypothetical protein [Deltaproteobacteria bacterium]MBT6504424.1 hypothetical protein [Deltaproteobacteria bacterium]MBT7888296.1 hypothetical protein [Deltaproteobacteria bacterium]
MKTVLNKRIALSCLLILTCSLIYSVGFSQEQSYEARRQFYTLEKLIKLIEQARDAGMSDEDLKKMELQDGDRKINILEYMAELERLRAMKDKELEEFLSKKFLTINDIFNELIVSEPKVIKKLREKLVSDR